MHYNNRKFSFRLVKVFSVAFYSAARNDVMSTSMSTVEQGTPNTSASLPPVTVTAAFEKKKTLQPSKAKLEKLRETLVSLRYVECDGLGVLKALTC